MADQQTAWRSSEAFHDLTDALECLGHRGGEAALATLTIEQRKAVEREWTRRMQARCGIDPHRSPAEVKAEQSKEGAKPTPVDTADLVARGARTDAEREVAHLFVEEGLAIPEIAQRLGRSPAGIKTSLYIMRRKARGIDLAQQRREQAVRLFHEDKSQEEIAAALGVTRQRVSQILRSEGLHVQDGARRAEAERLHHQGEPRRVIAARMGIQVRQVNRLLRESLIFARAPRVGRQEAA